MKSFGVNLILCVCMAFMREPPTQHKKIGNTIRKKNVIVEKSQNSNHKWGVYGFKILEY